MNNMLRVLAFWSACVPTLAQVPLIAGSLLSPIQQDDREREIAELRAEIERLRGEHAEQLEALEEQLAALELQMLRAAAEATPVAAAPTQSQVTYNALNPAISIVANFLGRADTEKVFNDAGARIDNGFNLRETELDMRLPVDPYADAVLIVAMESESPGEFEVGIEEGYVNIKQLPFMASPLGLKFQVGRFRPAFGKFNLLHTHALPQSQRSLTTEVFLGEEGFIQDGISVDFFVPSPWSDNDSLNARLQVLGGGGIAVSPDSRDRTAYLGNLRWFRTLGDAHSAEVAWSSYWHPGNDQGPIARLHGVDFTYFWKPLRQGEWRSFLAGGELLFTDAPADPAGQRIGPRPFGASVYSQWQLDRRKYIGFRWDDTQTLEDTAIERRSLTPYLTYYFSEFLRLRLNFEHRWSDLVEEDGRNTVFAELNWIFGAHPPEPFWVNR